jgi:sigma-B regulation protein RsbU (phosphoserine phosphatase)
VLALVLLVGAWLADDLTGNEATSSLYYLTAIAFATWYLGRQVGLAMAALSSLSWLATYFLVGAPYSRTSVLVWNLAGEAVIYAAFAWGLGLLHERMHAERLLAERLALANDRLEREAQLVARLQSDMLPPAPPGLPGYRWSIRYEPSARAGGDYYEFLLHADGRVGVLIADATGHGASAAVLMAMARSAFFMAARDLRVPGLVLSEMNRHLARIVPSGWFVTAAYVILDPRSGSFDYSLAGHDPPLVLRSKSGRLETLAVHGGPILGPLQDTTYPAASGRLLPGDALVLYTDGLPEAVDPDGRLLGEEPVREALEGAPHDDPDAMRDRVLERVAAHRSGAAAADDLTLLILQRDG